MKILIITVRLVRGCVETAGSKLLGRDCDGRILIRSRSRLRSSSLVTRYCALPRDSRLENFIVVWITTDLQRANGLDHLRAGKDQLHKRFCFPGIYSNRRINRGRISTSASSSQL